MNISASQQEFIRFCLANNVLAFGDFTLKSGLKSHYFFNAGLFNTNKAISLLGQYYAHLIHDEIIKKNNLKFDGLFGPAYKGITLATTASIALYNNYQYETDVAFNRKEVKTHGEGGNIIGADVTNKNLLLIDDVISAGTATRDSINLLKHYNANIVGMVIAMDRKMPMDMGDGKQLTAAQVLQQEFNIPIFSIISIDDVIEFTRGEAEYQHLTKLLVKAD